MLSAGAPIIVWRYRRAHLDQTVQVLLVHGEPVIQMAHNLLKRVLTLLELF
jgi:hypothetical protein